MGASARSDFEGMLDLARDKSVEARTRLVQMVGDLFFDTARDTTAQERALMSDILNRLVRDVEKSVRQTLAVRLATAPTAPHDLVVALANDDIEVAEAVLVDSRVLQDPDLIEIVRIRTFEHRLAVTRRKTLSGGVSQALVEVGELDVIAALLNNQGAEIEAATMAYLVDESRRVDKYQNPLLRRYDLTGALARQMYVWVIEALRAEIAHRYKIDRGVLDAELAAAVDELSGQHRPGAPADDLARHVAQRNAMDPHLLTQALREGKINLFQSLVAEFSELPGFLVQRFIYEEGGRGLATVCKALGIAKAEFATIFLLSRGARPGGKSVATNEVSEVLAFYDRLRPATARQVVGRWRLDPNFARTGPADGPPGGAAPPSPRRGSKKKGK
jgi:uncharacterized protein (DUF2336 family)